MDVVSLYQSGVRNVSASLGTALTDNQARLIKRYTKNVVLSYDADSAGIKAADRGIDILYQEGLVAKVMQVSDGKDPDEFVKAHGKGAFMELADNALSYGDFKISVNASKYDLEDPQQRVEFLESSAAILRRMKPVEADIYIKRLAADYDISENAVRAQYNMGTGRSQFRQPQAARRTKGAALSETESDLLKLALLEEKYAQALREKADEVFPEGMARDLFDAIAKCDDGIRPMDPGMIREYLEEDAAEAFEKVLAVPVSSGNEDRMFRDCMDSLRRRRLEEEADMLTNSLVLAEQEENSEAIDKISIRLMEIQKQLKDF